MQVNKEKPWDMTPEQCDELIKLFYETHEHSTAVAGLFKEEMLKMADDEQYFKEYSLECPHGMLFMPMILNMHNQLMMLMQLFMHREATHKEHMESIHSELKSTIKFLTESYNSRE